MDPSLGALTGMLDQRLVAMLAIVAVLAQSMVNVVKAYFATPRWVPPMLALNFSVGLVLLVMVAIGIFPEIPKYVQLIGQGIIVALLASLAAVGATALQDNVKASSDKTVRTTRVDLELSGDDEDIDNPPAFLDRAARRPSLDHDQR